MDNDKESKKDIDDIIKRVTSESGKTEAEIRSLMDKRKEATHGLLSDYGAVYAVAKEFGVTISSGGAMGRGGIESMKTIFSKLNEVSPQKPFSVIARVKSVYPPRDFKKKDGKSGKFASVLLLDETGECRLVLWDKATDIVNKLKKNDILVVRNAYGKESFKGDGVELHAGSLTHISLNPKNIEKSLLASLPEVKDEFVKVKNINLESKDVNMIARIYAVYPPTEFTRSDGTTGFRASIICEDDTGRMRIVLWGEPAKSSLESLKRGDFVKIENAYAKEGLKQDIELHISSLGRVLKVDDKKGIPKEILNLPELADQGPSGGSETLTIDEIKTDSTGFSLNARVINVFNPKPYSNGTFSSMIVGDTKGTIRVVLWNEKSDIVNDIKAGDAVNIKNVYAKENLNKEPEVHVGQYSEVTVDSKTTLPPLEEIEKSLVSEKKIKDLKAGDSYVRINGKLVDIDTNRRITYFTCGKCGMKIANLGMGWYCDTCEEEVDPQANLVISFTVEDSSGSIRAVSFRDDAEKILGIDLGEIMNLIGEARDEATPLESIKEDILNTELALVGRVRYSNFSEQLEFLVSEVLA